MRRWTPLLLTVPLLLTGCFGRLAQYDGEGPQKPPADGPLAPYDPGQAPMAVERIMAFIMLRNPFLSPSMVRLQAEAIVTQATSQAVPINLLVSLIATESSFNPRAVSPVGAQGLGQLMPPTARDMGISDPFDPQQNIFATTKYLAWLGRVWASHPRRWEMALASYLAGVGTVSNQVKAGRDLTNEQSAYVRKILKLSSQV